MHVQFALPDLFWPDRAVTEPYTELSLPALERLIGRGRRTLTDSDGFEHWLGRQLRDPTCSLAQARRAADFPHTADARYWVCADPCHLEVTLDTLALTDAASIGLSAAEAQSLVKTLADHFAAEGIAWAAPAPDRWYIALPSRPDFTTPPPRRAVSGPLAAHLPSGPDGARWRAWLNEVQMLLHEHPVNETRAAHQQPTVNSVWLWGHEPVARTDPAPIAPATMRCWFTDDPLTRGVALTNGESVSPLPAGTGFNALHRSEGVATVVLTAAHDSATRGRTTDWRDTLSQWEREWFAPSLAALAAGRVSMISLVAIGSSANLSVETTRGDLRYFWRRARVLASYVNPTDAATHSSS